MSKTNESMSSEPSEMCEILRDIRAQLTKLIKFTVSEKIEQYLEIPELRRDVLNMCDGTHTVGEIAKQLGKRQPNVSSAIADLLVAGFIRPGHKEGRSVFYVAVP